MRKYSLRTALKPVWRQDAAKSAGTSRSSCCGSRFRSSGRFLGNSWHTFYKFVPFKHKFPVRATKDSREETIGGLGLTPPIETITHVFPERLLGIDKSGKACEIRLLAGPADGAHLYHQSHETRIPIFERSACLHNKAKTSPPAVTACALQPALAEVIWISG